MKKPTVVVSEKWKLIKPDLLRLLRGAMYAAIGAAGSYAMSYIGMLDFGQYQPFAAIPVSFIIHLLVKLVSYSEYKASE